MALLRIREDRGRAAHAGRSGSLVAAGLCRLPLGLGIADSSRLRTLISVLPSMRLRRPNRQTLPPMRTLPASSIPTRISPTVLG